MERNKLAMMLLDFFLVGLFFLGVVFAPNFIFDRGCLGGVVGVFPDLVGLFAGIMEIRGLFWGKVAHIKANLFNYVK
jgi:hypothetical protein